MYSSTNIFRVNISRRRWGHVARKWEMRASYWVLVQKSMGKRPLGRHRWRWEFNIKMDLQEMECGRYGLGWSGSW